MRSARRAVDSGGHGSRRDELEIGAGSCPESLARATAPAAGRGWRGAGAAVGFGVRFRGSDLDEALVRFWHRLIALTALPLALHGAAAEAQDAPLAIEMGVGVAIPVGSFSNGSGPGEPAESGANLGLLFTLRHSPLRTFYIGFSQQRFACGIAGCPASEPYVATGFNAGIRLALLTRGPVRPWLGVGALTTRVETQGLPAPNTGVSKLGLGGEAGAGFYIRAASFLAFAPSVSYSVVNSTLPGGASLGLRYVTSQLGFVLIF
jgi:hypothetical protein